MSLHMQAEKARLTVLGTGWSNTAIDSGEGFTIDGEMWKDIATELGYDFGDDVDWDNIAENEWPDFDWSQVIYKTPDGNVYTDPDGTGVWTMPAYEMPDGTIYTDQDGDGVWTNPDTDIEYPGGGSLKKIEYPGGGKPYIPENTMVDFSDKLSNIAAGDSGLAQYSIAQSILDSLPIGGPVSSGGRNPAHLYSPPANYYILSSNSIIYTAGKLSHKPEGGSDYSVVEANFAVHGSEARTAYFDNCQPLYSEVGGASIVSSLPSAYSGLSSSRDDVRHKYLVWQLCYGSFDDALIEATDDTIPTDDIRNGTSGLESIDYAEQRYYRMKDKQVADRL